nr:response regulator transcription factor [Kibdelosporangium sp. MJ126-NF4]
MAKSDNAVVDVVIGDEQPLIRRGLRALIEAESDLSVVGEAEDCEQLRVVLGLFPPAIVVLDAGLPGIADAAELTGELLGGRIAVILLAANLSSEHAVEVLRAGARGMLYKNDSPDELIRAIRTVAQGSAFLSPKVAGQLADVLYRGGWIPRQRIAANIEGLTDREHEIFRLIGDGLTNNEIALTLFISEATVKSHFNRICKKLGIVNRVQAVIMAHELGMTTG